MYNLYNKVISTCGYCFNHFLIPDQVNFPLTVIHGTKDIIRPWENV